MQTLNLTDHFLIAMPALEDPFFSRALIYIAEHNEHGALGLIVNRPMEINLATLFEKIAVPLEPADAIRLGRQPVLFGGPVQTERGFVLHRPVGKWQSTLAVTPEVGLTSSRDVLLAFASQSQPGEMLVTLGYSGWGPGQLEAEIARNDWLTSAVPEGLVFRPDDGAKWSAALRGMGIDPLTLSAAAGRA